MTFITTEEAQVEVKMEEAEAQVEAEAVKTDTSTIKFEAVMEDEEDEEVDEGSRKYFEDLYKKREAQEKERDKLLQAIMEARVKNTNPDDVSSPQVIDSSILNSFGSIPDVSELSSPITEEMLFQKLMKVANSDLGPLKFMWWILIKPFESYKGSITFEEYNVIIEKLYEKITFDMFIDFIYKIMGPKFAMLLNDLKKAKFPLSFNEKKNIMIYIDSLRAHGFYLSSFLTCLIDGSFEKIKIDDETDDNNRILQIGLKHFFSFGPVEKGKYSIVIRPDPKIEGLDASLSPEELSDVLNLHLGPSPAETEFNVCMFDMSPLIRHVLCLAYLKHETCEMWEEILFELDFTIIKYNYKKLEFDFIDRLKSLIHKLKTHDSA